MCWCVDVENGVATVRPEQVDKLISQIMSSDNLRSQLHYKIQKKPTPSTKKKNLKGTLNVRLGKLYKYHPRDDIHTEKFLNNRFNGWEGEPLSFWNRAQDSGYVCNEFEDVIGACIKLQEEDVHSTITRRLYCVVIHRHLEKTKRCLENKIHVQEIVRRLRCLDHLDNYTDQELAALIKTQKDAGSRYEHIAIKLGIGSLFTLGQIIPRTIWESKFPMVETDESKDAIAHLKEVGINELGKKYTKLATTLIGSLQDKLPTVASHFENQYLRGERGHLDDSIHHRKRRHLDDGNPLDLLLSAAELTSERLSTEHKTMSQTPSAELARPISTATLPHESSSMLNENATMETYTNGALLMAAGLVHQYQGVNAVYSGLEPNSDMETNGIGASNGIEISTSQFHEASFGIGTPDPEDIFLPPDEDPFKFVFLPPDEDPFNFAFSGNFSYGSMSY